MLKANVKIEAGKKSFKPGQEVKGLSRVDKKWMLERGYVSELPDEKKEAAKEEESTEGKKHGSRKKDEL